MFAGAADRDDTAILCAAPAGAAALRLGGFVEQVVHSDHPLVAKFVLKQSGLPACRGAAKRPPRLRDERMWNPPAVSGAGPNIVRTAGVCQRVKGAIPGKTIAALVTAWDRPTN